MFGDIVLCEFPFTSGASSKVRPALVLFDLTDDVIICRITSVPYDGPNDVAIVQWAEAGLLKPSVIRLDRLITAQKQIVIRKLGALTEPDREAIREAWNNKMRL